MPSMGLDFKAGRGWGGKRRGKLYSLSLGCIRFWWISDIVTDVLERNRISLIEAANELRIERDRRIQALAVLQPQWSK